MTKQEEELIGHIVNNSHKIKYENDEYLLNGLRIKLNYEAVRLEIGGVKIDMYDQGYLAEIEFVLERAKRLSKNNQIEDIIQRINNKE